MSLNLAVLALLACDCSSSRAVDGTGGGGALNFTSGGGGTAGSSAQSTGGSSAGGAGGAGGRGTGSAGSGAGSGGGISTGVGNAGSDAGGTSAAAGRGGAGGAGIGGHGAAGGGSGGSTSDSVCAQNSDCVEGHIFAEILAMSDCPCVFGCQGPVLNRQTVDRRSAQFDMFCASLMHIKDGQGNNCPAVSCVSPVPGMPACVDHVCVRAQ